MTEVRSEIGAPTEETTTNSPEKGSSLFGRVRRSLERAGQVGALAALPLIPLSDESFAREGSSPFENLAPSAVENRPEPTIQNASIAFQKAVVAGLILLAASAALRGGRGLSLSRNLRPDPKIKRALGAVGLLGKDCEGVDSFRSWFASHEVEATIEGKKAKLPLALLSQREDFDYFVQALTQDLSLKKARIVEIPLRPGQPFSAKAFKQVLLKVASDTERKAGTSLTVVRLAAENSDGRINHEKAATDTVWSQNQDEFFKAWNEIVVGGLGAEGSEPLRKTTSGSPGVGIIAVQTPESPSSASNFASLRLRPLDTAQERSAFLALVQSEMADEKLLARNPLESSERKQLGQATWGFNRQDLLSALAVIKSRDRGTRVEQLIDNLASLKSGQYRHREGFAEMPNLSVPEWVDRKERQLYLATALLFAAALDQPTPVQRSEFQYPAMVELSSNRSTEVEAIAQHVIAQVGGEEAVDVAFPQSLWGPGFSVDEAENSSINALVRKGERLRQELEIGSTKSGNEALKVQLAVTRLRSHLRAIFEGGRFPSQIFTDFEKEVLAQVGRRGSGRITGETTELIADRIVADHHAEEQWAELREALAGAQHEIVAAFV